MLADIAMHLLPADVPLWAGALAFAALFYTAVVDARTGLVPPVPLAVAAMALMASLLASGADRAFTEPSHALLVYALIFAVNEVHYRITGRDALGLGDAHWSLVATLAFGAPAVLLSWGLGAWLALLWLGARRLCGKPAGQVYFVPFLFIALVVIRLMPPLAV